MAKVTIIGGGFSGLASACFAAKAGHDVTLFEKNSTVGGRARDFSEQGFLFDMGPSWYWMPDVFEKFFKFFDKSVGQYYKLSLLDPGFQMIFGNSDTLAVPANTQSLYDLFESIEKGSSLQLKKFLKEAEFKYNVSMDELIYKPAFSWLEFANWSVIKGAAKTHLLKSFSTYVRRFFKDERLIALMEFPVLFLGAMPNQIPALYSLMNYSALVQGTWYPQGGMLKIIEGMKNLALELGVKFETDAAVSKINIESGKAKSITVNGKNIAADAFVASCDYAHADQNLLEPEFRNYNEKYWEEKVFAPSCLIFYVGVNKRIPKLIHHNLFFDTDFEAHSKDIYQNPKWPDNPLFYVCCPSKTDKTVAPEGMENLFLLVPVAPGLNDSEKVRESYFDGLIKRIENYTGEKFSENIVYKKSYCINDFVKDYNAYKGNAYGLANTLKQTAVLKPTLRNKKVKNLFYTGQLTVPGPGVPPALISAEIVVKELNKALKK